MESQLKSYLNNVKLGIAWSYAYYTKDNPIATDYEYNLLINKIKEFELNNPKLVASDSPTQKVGDSLLEGFEKRTHLVRLYSLDDKFTLSEVAAWIMSLPAGTTRLKLEPKYDGASLNLLYINGLLVAAITRGDGVTGEDVTENAKLIGNIPHEIKHKGTVEVRGEVTILTEDFESVNERRIARGKDSYSNQRNGAAGALRTFSSEHVKDAMLHFTPYSIGENSLDLSTQEAEFDFFMENGFEILTAKGENIQFFANTIGDIEKIYNTMVEMRDKYPMLLDGLVIKVDDKDLQDELGFTNKFPRWAIAFKFPPVEKVSIVRSIKVQVGKTGAVTPIAEIDPIELGGAIIRRVTLHNFDEIERKDIKIGDSVIIIRSGDVIPKLTKVLTDRRDGTEITFTRPENCPTCGSTIVSEKDVAVIKCSNENCPSILLGRFQYAVSRKALTIADLGTSTLESLLKLNLISGLDSLFKLTVEDLLKVDGFRMKKADKIYNSIQSIVGNVEAHRLLNAIDIPLIGQSASETLMDIFSARIFESPESITYEELINIETIGEESALAFLEFMNENSIYVKSVAEIVNPVFKEKLDTTGNKLHGKKVVITGVLSKPRSHFEELAKAAGAKVSKSISKNIDFLVAGENAGSKLDKARSLSLSILDESEFLALLQ